MSLQSKPPEFQLVVTCCSPLHDGPAGIDLGSIDWSLFERVVARHRVAGLVDRTLSSESIPVPRDIRSRLRAEAGAIRTRNLILAGAMIRLDRELPHARIDHLFVKGLTLGQIAYGDFGLKMGWDIDLLVEFSDVAGAATVLRRLGYEPVLPTAADSAALKRWHGRSKESVWADANGVHLELHTRLADNKALIPSLGLASRRQAALVAGREFETLETGELISYLCVHGASSAWFRLKWIADLAALLAGFGPKDLDGVYEQALQLRTGRAVSQALLLSHVLFGVPLSQELLTVFCADRATVWLTSVALDSLEGTNIAEEPTESWFGTLGIHASQFALLPGWRFKLSEAVRQLGSLVHR